MEERHKDLYSEIRSTVSDRISNEERVPSQTSMWRHWLRSCRMSEMWRHAPQSDIFSELNPPEQSGWKKKDNGSYVFDWDSQEQVKGTIEFLTKCCFCKKKAAKQSTVEAVKQDGIVVLGATVMPAPTCLKVQNQTTRIRMTNLMLKVRSQARRTRTHNAQVALRMNRRMV